MELDRKLFKKSVIFEDNHLLVLNKPAGILVHGDQTGDKSLLDFGKEYLKAKYNKPGNVFLNPAHRLDRPVSGVIVFARTDKALKRLNNSFKSRTPQKKYLAVCQGIPNPLNATLTNYLRKNAKVNKAYVAKKNDNQAKIAKLSYQCIGQNRHASLLELKLYTGRPHQIRVQLAHNGNVIVGDKKYGSKEKLDGQIMLHARQISFKHPVKKEEIRLMAAIPEFWKSTKYFNDFSEIVDQ